MSSEECRAEIDRVDAEILGLLKRRFHLSGNLMSWKVENGMPVTDPAREKEILEKAISSVSASRRPGDTFSVASARDIFRLIIDRCKIDAGMYEEAIKRAFTQCKDENWHGPILDEIREILDSRQGHYGAPEVAFNMIADMVSVVLKHKLKEGSTIDARDVGLISMCIKIVRIVNSGRETKLDSLLDLIGYSTCFTRVVGSTTGVFTGRGDR